MGRGGGGGEWGVVGGTVQNCTATQKAPSWACESQTAGLMWLGPAGNTNWAGVGWRGRGLRPLAVTKPVGGKVGVCFSLTSGWGDPLLN